MSEESDEERDEDQPKSSLMDDLRAGNIARKIRGEPEFQFATCSQEVPETTASDPDPAPDRKSRMTSDPDPAPDRKSRMTFLKNSQRMTFADGVRRPRMSFFAASFKKNRHKSPHGT
jgi:hypothetical protein